MLMRVAVGIHKRDIDAAIEVENIFGLLHVSALVYHQTYNLMSERWFTHASPTMFNAGTCKPQLSSCFLVTMKDDSIEVYIRFSNAFYIIQLYFRVFMRHSRLVPTFLNLLEGLASMYTALDHVVVTLLALMVHPMGWSQC